MHSQLLTACACYRHTTLQVFDEDGSGFLETKEVLAILTRMTPASCQLSMDDAKAFIELFDRDGADGEDKDGKISFKEFVNMMNSMSKKHDTVKKTGAETKSEDFAEKLADGHEAKKYRDDDSIKMDTGLYACACVVLPPSCFQSLTLRPHDCRAQQETRADKGGR